MTQQHKSKHLKEMLMTLDDNILDKENLNIVRKRSKKTQILLYDTQRKFDEFVMKLKYRYGGNYNDIPHFIIAKNGNIYQLFDTKFSSNTFGDPKNDKKIIKIALENSGWFNKNTITGVWYNWIGDKLRVQPFIKKWRGYYYWDEYTDSQMKSVEKLCGLLCDINKIPYTYYTKSIEITSISKFNGIVCKSNYGNIYTDINPSFNFNIFDNDAEKRL